MSAMSTGDQEPTCSSSLCPVSVTLTTADTVDREIFVLKIFCALKFHGAKFS